jgi:hypothetical protein
MTQEAKLIAIPDPVASPSTGPLVVECIDARHPTLTGRVQVRWRVDGQETTCWLPTLRGLAVRTGDRVLVSHPRNWDEAIVVGVIDGFARRPRPSREHAATLDLLADEAVCIRSETGAPLLELTSSERGVEITLLQPDVSLEVDGKLAIGAKQITLTAREGEARIEATDDVVVEGENIHLN